MRYIQLPETMFAKDEDAYGVLFDDWMTYAAREREAIDEEYKANLKQFSDTVAIAKQRHEDWLKEPVRQRCGDPHLAIRRARRVAASWTSERRW